MKDSFVFYRSFYDAITELEDGQKGRVFTAIADYALNQTEPSLTGVEKCIFILAKPQIDANNKRYENGKKGAEYGKLGGRPKKNKTPKKPQETPKETPNVNVNVNVNDKKKNIKKKIGKRIPDDWEVSEKLGIWSEGKGMTRGEILHEEEAFKLYWENKSGKDGIKLNWDKAFQAWILNNKKWSGK